MKEIVNREVIHMEYDLEKLVLDILRLVSIHHMLLFIFSETTGLSKKASFNTSHVTLYRNE